MVADRSVNTERQAPEPPKRAKDDRGEDTKDDGLGFTHQTPRGENKVVEYMCKHQDREV
jgi:hypothetical protein